MALLFADSFSIYATADLPTRWVGGAQGTLIDSAILPPNAQAGAQVLDQTGGSAGVKSNNYGSLARMIAGFRMYMPNTGTEGIGSVMFFDWVSGFLSEGHNIKLAVDRAGTYIINGGTGATIVSGPVIPLNEWHHYEIDVIFGTASNATVALYLDGNPTPFMYATGFSLPSATSNNVILGDFSVLGVDSVSSYKADFYLLSGAGPVAEFNSALAPQGLGGAKVAFAVPTGPGIVSAWTPNGAATIWQCINQIPQDGDTTYASDANPGDQYQVVFGSLPAMQDLIAVQLSTYARTDDAGPRAYQSGFYSGGTYAYSGMNQYLGGSYMYIQDEFMTNPVTGNPWVPGDLTGLQYGAKLTV
jgi:hypothetical protein